MSRTLLCDISAYQDAPATSVKPELDQMKKIGIQGVIIRCSQNLYLDKLFEYYYNECQIHNIPFMTYGFLQYWSGSADPASQGKFIADWFKDKKKVRAWCDYERPNMNYPALPPRIQALDQIHQWMDAVDAGMAIESGLYTNLSTIAYLSPIPDWLINRPFWLAWPPAVPSGMDVVQYTKNMTPPVVPFPNLKTWQFTWTLPGIQAGMESGGLDGDWFMGTLEELILFSAGTYPVINLKQELVEAVKKLSDLIEQLP